MSLQGDLAPLQGILNEILGRIQAIEDKVGTSSPENASSDGATDTAGKTVFFRKFLL